jgi:hypothetical protein
MRLNSKSSIKIPSLHCFLFLSFSVLATPQDNRPDGSNQVLAVVGERRVTVEDLPQNVRGQLERLHSEQYRILHRATREKIDELLLDRAAAPLPPGPVTLAQILSLTGFAPAEVTNEEIDIACELSKDRYPGLDSRTMREKMRKELAFKRNLAARALLLDRLYEQYRPQLFIPPPKPPTVGC